MVGSSSSPPWLNYIELLHDLRTPTAPSPTHSHHSLSHPSIHIHQHCKPSHFRYYPFSHRQILSSASNQTELADFHHPSPDHRRTTGSAHPDPYHYQEHRRVFCLSQALITRENWVGLQLQCPPQAVAPPAQHNQQYPPHPPLPYPPPDETVAHAAASAIQNPAHHNRAPAKK
jgi:hypothetical protein